MKRLSHSFHGFERQEMIETSHLKRLHIELHLDRTWESAEMEMCLES